MLVELTNALTSLFQEGVQIRGWLAVLEQVSGASALQSGFAHIPIFEAFWSKFKQTFRSNKGRWSRVLPWQGHWDAADLCRFSAFSG